MQDLITSPISFPQVPPTLPKWEVLMLLFNRSDPSTSPITFTRPIEGWRIREVINNTEVFNLRRDTVTMQRYTDTDLFGLLGTSLLNVNDDHCYLTEGVSDYITAKLLMPDKNVLGVTTLGGKPLARRIIISLFKRCTIITDNDATGQKNALSFKNFLNSKGVKVRIWHPDGNLKDLTDAFLFNYKISPEDIQF